MAETCRYLRIRTTAQQLRAGRYLESRGQVFCGHFGTENAIRIARELRRKERAKDKAFLQSCGIAIN